jgi:hypothetical protein
MTNTKTMSGTAAVAERFNTLAQQEKWFEIQDELFADNIQSLEPAGSPWLKNAEGKTQVRKKGEDWVSRITAVHHAHTTTPIVAGDYFVVGREVDISVTELGRIAIDQLMVYQVKEGRIVSEQFFY